jgi:cobalt/nickel transport system permease protein
MIFFATILLPFADTTKTSEVLTSIIGTKIYQSGLNSFFLINIKMLLVFASSMLVIRICGTFRLFKSLESLKFPVWIISILLYMRHLFYLLSIEQSRIHAAFSARYRYLPIFKRIKLLKGIVIIYLTRTLERSDRIYLAMLSKGFSGKIPNTIKTPWRISDSLFCCGFIIYFGLILYV